MSQADLHQIESMIGRLDVREQVQLLEHVVPKVADRVLCRWKPTEAGKAAWARYRHVADPLAATSGRAAPSMLEELSRSMR